MLVQIELFIEEIYYISKKKLETLYHKKINKRLLKNHI